MFFFLQLKKYELVVLGGQHIVGACQKIMAEYRHWKKKGGDLLALGITKSLLDLCRNKNCILYEKVSYNNPKVLLHSRELLCENL